MLSIQKREWTRGIHVVDKNQCPTRHSLHKAEVTLPTSRVDGHNNLGPVHLVEIGVVYGGSASLVDLLSLVLGETLKLGIVVDPLPHSHSGRIVKAISQSAYDIEIPIRNFVKNLFNISISNGVGHGKHIIFLVQVVHIPFKPASLAIHKASLEVKDVPRTTIGIGFRENMRPVTLIQHYHLAVVCGFVALALGPVSRLWQVHDHLGFLWRLNQFDIGVKC
mmetsp:Transcript_4084/g.6938  ORF Transcript_4084/g.6938 Transcript_4084/m.6938 type:complete len:221 (+) Transcript_4084:623-1285(+)